MFVNFSDGMAIQSKLCLKIHLFTLQYLEY